MMMAQTAIHTLVELEPGITPSLLLESVNKVIYANLKKCASTKYITINILTYEGAGQFTYAGMHLPLLIYRHKTKQVEKLENDGMWLGIIEQIEGMNANHTFCLEKNDCLLLYTDGITEAVHKEVNMQFYGDERLAAMLVQNGELAPQKIIDALLDDIASYETTYDDVTLFAIKYGIKS